MNIIKGFVTINQYINNTPGQIAPLGELSTWSLTYTKELGEYQSNIVPGYKLVTFKCIDTITNIANVVNSIQVTQIVELVKEAVNYSSVNIRPFDPDDFRNTLLAAFNSRVSNINFGEFVDNGFIALPEWISWDSLEDNNPTVKIWLSDQSFADQYDEYDITIIPPLTNLNNFFNSFSVVTTELDTRTLSVFGDLIQQAKDNKPETYLRILTSDLVNALNHSQTYTTNWAVLIYGKTGDNIDAIKDAIVDYALNHSVHTRSQWENILPDLFKRTEFILLPRWDKESIPNLTQLAGLYSSMLDPFECIEFAKLNVPFYADLFIQNNTTVFPYDFKSISIVAVNGFSNIPGKERINQIFHDYIPVPSTSTDFNRMQIKTREWILLIELLLIHAETANEFSSVPNQLRRVKRDGMLFISALYDNVNYLVAAKSNSFYGV